MFNSGDPQAVPPDRTSILGGSPPRQGRRGRLFSTSGVVRAARVGSAGDSGHLARDITASLRRSTPLDATSLARSINTRLQSTGDSNFHGWFVVAWCRSLDL